jgi:hypothetical protein
VARRPSRWGRGGADHPATGPCRSSSGSTSATYRKAPGPEIAVGDLRRHAGTQFDPEVVAALCRVLDRGGVGERSGPLVALAA